MIRSNWLYIAVMFAVSYTIRILPLTLIRKPIKNQFIQSFLYYVPYVTLAVMTFPAIVNATQSPIAGAAHPLRRHPETPYEKSSCDRRGRFCRRTHP